MAVYICGILSHGYFFIMKFDWFDDIIYNKSNRIGGDNL